MKISFDTEQQWEYVNGQWRYKDGIFESTNEEFDDDGLGIQGYRYAFSKDTHFKTFSTTFQVRHYLNFADVGFIFGAANAKDFYILHFPDCVQASRGQSFWVQLSKMDDSGVLRSIKTSLVNRVQSTPRNIWHEIEVEVSDDGINVVIDEMGVFQVDNIDVRSGAVGFMLFQEAQIKDFHLEGDAVEDSTWGSERQQSPHWFYPIGEPEYGDWQQPHRVIRLANNDLLLSFSTQKHGVSWGEEKNDYLIRSSDNGRTWSTPELLPLELQSKFGFLHHIFPDGVMRAIINDDRYESAMLVAESYDDGKTWSSPISVKIPQAKTARTVNVAPMTLINLANGSVLATVLGAIDPPETKNEIACWGSVHHQAWSVISYDNGASWTDLSPMDNHGLNASGVQIDCNMDLTEVSAVEVKDDKLMALIRPVYSPWMWETWSKDGGKTWGPCVRGPFASYACSNMIKTADDTLVIAGRLPGLTVHCGRELGKYWDQGTMIDSGLWAMGSMIEVEDNLVLFVYWDSNYSYMRAQHLKITEAGLVAVKY